MKHFTGTHKENRIALAQHLRENVTDEDYAHDSLYTGPCCALGHALRLVPELEPVFGYDCWNRVFSGHLRHTRLSAAQALEDM